MGMPALLKSKSRSFFSPSLAWRRERLSLPRAAPVAAGRAGCLARVRSRSSFSPGWGSEKESFLLLAELEASELEARRLAKPAAVEWPAWHQAPKQTSRRCLQREGRLSRIPRLEKLPAASSGFSILPLKCRRDFLASHLKQGGVDASFRVGCNVYPCPILGSNEFMNSLVPVALPP